MAAIQKEYLRSVLFGIEDSLVSTTGLIAGLSVGAENKRIVVLGGLVAIVIESVSMAAGEYLSDDAVQELDKLKRHRDSPAADAPPVGAASLGTENQTSERSRLPDSNLSAISL